MSGWVHNLIWFALGAFLGPWVLGFVTGAKNKTAAY